ncbi:hypothetical protein LTR85_010400 [Meristemomyces frigidus]|nr:hypothetical protein LTR85_010400 [Meristemomyces frigidus]
MAGDGTWSRGNSVVLASDLSQSRAYSMRTIGLQSTDRQKASPPMDGQGATQPPDRQKASPPPDRQRTSPPPDRQRASPPPNRQNSLVNNPNNVPTFNAPPLSQQAQKFAEIEQKLKKEALRLTSQLSAAQSTNANLRQQIDDNVRVAQRRAVEHRAAVDKARDDVRKEVAAELDLLKAQRLNATRRATDAEQQARSLEEQVKESHEHNKALVQRHSKEILMQRQLFEKQLDAELRVVMQGRQLRKDTERSSYDAYRKIYDDLNRAASQFSTHVVQHENARFIAARFLDKQSAYSEQMEHFDPWFKRKYPKLLEQLDQYQRDHRQEAEASGNAIRKLRFEQQDIQDALRGSAHVSRALTRYHRLSDAPSLLTMTDVLLWTAHNQPLRTRRDEIETEMKRVQRSIDLGSNNAALVARHKQELETLQASRSQLSRVLYYQARVRDGEALQALLTDSYMEKEAFAMTLKPTMQIDEATGAWRMLIADDPFYDEDSDISKGDQQTIRRGHMDKAGEVRDRLHEFEKLVRKRSVLEQSLGLVPAQRVKEVDDVIHERIRLKKVEERGALARLGISSVSRSSSFARPSPAKFPATRTLRRHSSEPTLTSASTASRVRTPPVRRAASESGTRATLIASGLRLGRLNARRKETPAGPLRAEIENEMVLLREVVNKAEIALHESKLPKLREAHGPNHPHVKRIEQDINNKRRSLALGASLPGSAMSRGRRSRASSPLRAQPQPEAADTAAEDREGDPTSSRPSNLNLQPTAAKQAAHAGWPAGYRLFHAEGARLGFGTEHASAHSQPPAMTEPFYYSTKDAGNHIMDASAGESPPPASRGSNEMTQLCSSDSPAGKGDANSNVEHARPTKSDGKLVPGQNGNDATAGSEIRQTSPVAAAAVGAVGLPEGKHAARSSDDDKFERDVALTYRIPAADYRNAVMASRNSNAAFWTYKLYKNPDGKTPTVHYCTNFKQAEEQAQKFLDEPVLGFDIEWEPFVPKDKVTIKKSVSLIQIATEDKIGLFQIARFFGDTAEQLMPPSLRKLLESDQTIKAGVNVTGDARRMEQYLGVKMRAQFELSHLYKVVGMSGTKPGNVNKRMVNLAAQVQEVLLLPLKKDDVRVSNWTKWLSSQQSEYSASDAYAGFQLFHALKAKRKKMDPMPPRPAFYELHKPLVLGDGTVVVAKQPSRKYSKGATAAKAGELDDEFEEEYFDAVESSDTYDECVQQVAGLSLSGLSVTYPTLPQFDESAPAVAQSKQAPPVEVEPEVAEKETAAVGDSTPAARPSTKPSLPASTEIERAETWVKEFQAAREPGDERKTHHATLRAWHMWHEQGLDVKQVAALLRETPLQTVTVASYILQAIMLEDLPFDAARVKEALSLMPPSVLWRYRKILDKARALASA